MRDEIKINPQVVTPLKRICMSIGEIPTSYLETMTYYEMLIWFINFLRDQVIPVVNNNGEAVAELQNLFVELQNYVNDYFDNLDVQEEINNKLDQMLEDGVLEQIIEQFLKVNSILSFDTVTNMKIATNLVNGSFAKTLGYYEINDSGSALYKITNEELTPNDGDIIELQNGLFAVLIPTTYITYKMFGAKLNGSDDDTDYVIKAHTYANTNNLKVVQNSGTLYLKTATTDNCPVVKTSCDFTGMIFKITEVQEQNRLMHIAHDSEERVVLSLQQIQQITNSASHLDFLENYPNSLISFTYSNVSIGIRPTGTPYEMYYSECCITDGNGNLIDGKLFRGFNDGSELEMFASSIFEKPIEIKGLSFEVDTTSSTYIPNIQIDRNNVTIKDVDVQIKNINTSNSNVYKGALLIFRRCYNYTLDNVNAENLSDYLSSGATRTQTTYIASSNLCHSCKVINSTIIRGWGPLQSEYCKNMTYENCTLGRIDNHYGCRDYYINNCTFTTSVAAIYIGFGDGTFTIENCKFIKNSDPTFYGGSNQNCIYLRNDLCALYSGTIIARNCEIENNTALNIRFISASYDNLNYGSHPEYILPCYFPKLIFENINTRRTSGLILIEELLRSSNYLQTNNLTLNNQNIYLNNCYCGNIDIRTEYADHSNAFNVKIFNTNILTQLRMQTNLDRVEFGNSNIQTSDIKNVALLMGTNLILGGTQTIENMTTGIFNNISDSRLKFTSSSLCRISNSTLSNSASLAATNGITDVIIDNCIITDNRDFHATNVTIKDSIYKLSGSSYINANQTNLARFVMINSLLNTESHTYSGFNAGAGVKVLLKDNYAMNEVLSDALANPLASTNTLGS